MVNVPTLYILRPKWILGLLVLSVTLIHVTIAAMYCFSIDQWIFWYGLFGLSLDLLAATIIVITDISWFDRLWQNEDRMDRAENLRVGRRTIYAQSQINEGDRGFEEMSDTIQSNADMNFIPTKIEYLSANRLGQKGDINVECQSGGVTYSNNIVELWIENKITELESGVRESIRAIGLVTLVGGFGLQLLAQILEGSVRVQNLILSNLQCL